MDPSGNVPFSQNQAEPFGAHRGARLQGTTSRTTQLPATLPPTHHASRAQSSNQDDQPRLPNLEQEEQSAALEDNTGTGIHPNPQHHTDADPPAPVHTSLTRKQIEEVAGLVHQILQSQPARPQQSARQTSMATDRYPTEDPGNTMDDRMNAATSFRPDRPTVQYSSPFAPEILESFPAPGTKIPTPEKYNGKTDPLDYLQHFQSMMNLYCVPDSIQCKAFCTAFQEGARRWFNGLPPNCITCFEDFRLLFLSQFATSKRPQKTALEVMQLTQGRNESLREFITRFNSEAVEVPDLTCSSMLAALMNNTRDEEFKKSLALDQPRSIQEIRNRADRYIQLEEVMKNTRRRMDDRSYQ